MSKIGIADNCGLKFSKDIKEYWEKKGHEVRFERGASQFIAQWADLYYFDWSDNNIHYIMNLYNGKDTDPQHFTPDWDPNKKPKIVVRAIDWDVWIGHARSQELVNFVDQWICIAPHIERKLRAEAEYFPVSKLKLIRPGVNLDRFTLKTKETDGYQIGMVLGDMWWYKNHMGGLDIFYELAKDDPKWHLHIRGQHESGEYNKVMYDHFIESRGLKDRVTLYDHVEDMNDWYENIDILLHPGMKETFCYAVGEAMAKGIRPVINNFYGAEDIWPREYLYNHGGEAIHKILAGEEKPKEEYRKHIEDNYNIVRMMKEFDELLGT